MAEYKNIVGTGFPPQIQAQIKKRESIVNSQTRDNNTLQFLTNRNAWVRLSSGVNINSNPAPIKVDLNIPTTNPNNFDPLPSQLPNLEIDTSEFDAGFINSIARNNILQGGIISLSPDNKTTLRGGFNETYTQGATDNLGFKPMPGITNVSITTGGKWQTLLQADIEFICYDLDQLDTMSKLYMSLGCTVFLEWGHTNYFKNDNTFEINPQPLNFFNENNKESLRKKVTNKIISTNGNYESITGTVYNFSYSANSDGSYNCKTSIMGAGGMVESLKINTATNCDFDLFSNKTDEADKFSSVLENALYTIKKFTSLVNLKDALKKEGEGGKSVKKLMNKISLSTKVRNQKTGEEETYGSLLNRIFQTPSYKGPEFTSTSVKLSASNPDNNVIYGNPWPFLSGHITDPKLLTPTANTSYNIFEAYRTTTQLDGPKSDHQTYITLGHLMALIQHLGIFTEGSKNNRKPVVYIDYNPELTIIKRGIIEASVDPSKCLIPYLASEETQNSFFSPLDLNQGNEGALWWTELGTKELNLLGSKKIDNAVDITKFPGLKFEGKLFKVLVNIDFAIDTLKNLSDNNEDKNVNLIEYIDAILNGINVSLGKVNALRTFYDDKSNCIRIIDENYQKSEVKDPQILTLENFGTKSTVYDYSFSSKITPKLAAQIVISAQALDSGIKEFSEDVLSYQKLNGNVRDRFAISKIPAVPPQTTNSQNNSEDLSPLKKLFHHFYNVYSLKDLKLGTISNLTTLYADLQTITIKKRNPSPTLLIPLEYQLTMDGISGILPYNIFRIPNSRLPKRYRGKVDFVVFSINHSIENNKWYTTLRGQTLIRN